VKLTSQASRGKIKAEKKGAEFQLAGFGRQGGKNQKLASETAGGKKRGKRDSML